MEDLKKKRATAKGQFTRAEGRLSTAVEESAIDEWTLTRRYDDLKVRWDAAQDAHDEYVSTLTAADKLDEEEQWINDLADRFDNLELAVGRKIKLMRAPEPTTDVKPIINQSEVMKSSHSESVIRVEKLKFQLFCGDIRKYPEFKAEFLQHVEPRCRKAELAFVLKSYLVDSVRQEISNVSEDYDKIWERLDQKYGNIGKLVDAILSEVKKLSTNRNDQSEILHMANIVEKAWMDLERLGQASELYNGTTISIIEQAMMTEMKMEWVKLVASKGYASKEKFLTLLEFLRDWRNRLEYLGADIRTDPASIGGVTHNVESQRVQKSSERQTSQTASRRKRCLLHSIDEAGEHPTWKCRLFTSKPVNERIEIVTANKACHRCLLIECPGASDNSKCTKGWKCMKTGCGGEHNRLLHTTDGTVNHTQASEEIGSNPILPLQEL